MKSIREAYSLTYDTSDFNSGLVKWYNNMIEKSYEELNITDVSKMIRQDVLKHLAEKRAIDLFIEYPYDGEFNDGDLLDMIISKNIFVTNFDKIQHLNYLLSKLEDEYLNFDWSSEECKERFIKNIHIMKRRIMQI